MHFPSKYKLHFIFIRHSHENEKLKPGQGSNLSMLLSKLICGYEYAALWLCIMLDKYFSLFLVFQTDCCYYCCIAFLLLVVLLCYNYAIAIICQRSTEARKQRVRSKFICAMANCNLCKRKKKNENNEKK